MSATPPRLCCPTCRGALGAPHETDGSFRCVRCDRVYPVREGVPSFLGDDDYYYGTLAREQAADLVALVAEKGQAGLAADLEGRKVKGRKVFLRSFDPSFADGRFVLPLDRESDVLDVGCGFGAMTLPISRAVRSVVSVDATFERVRFLKERLALEGIDNVWPLHASGLALPLPECCFDAVIFNGVLEWVGEWEQTRSPREVQLSALRHARERLRPDGVLFVAIENRTALELLYRRKDHNKLYGTSFLPRSLADLVTRLLKRKPYRTWTYTQRGYRHLLRDAGFGGIEVFCPWPRYQDPEQVIRYGDRAAAAHLRRTALRSHSPIEAVLFGMLAALGLDHPASPAFLIVARPR